jgi:ABC-2 type transport system ATP-binding protein
MIPEIQITKLTKSYPGNIEALKGIDLEIKKGDFFTLLGPNGAGKSTLLRILTTLSKKDSGDFLIGGVDPGKDFEGIMKHIGVASQENEIDPAEKVEKLLQFQARLYGCTPSHARQRTDELINQFKLTTERNKKAEVLSGGNKRRLHCALALIHKPGILFLDEPTTGMDPLARETFWDVITALNRDEGVTVLLTTQYLEEAEKYATKMALIIEGEIHFSGSVEGFKKKVHPDDDASLEESYLKYVKTLTKNTSTT